MSEQPKIELQPQQEIEKSKMESNLQPEEFDKFMVPEDWIENLSEAQKEAYRVKVCAFGAKNTRESRPWRFSGEEESKDGQPTPNDYKVGEAVNSHFYGRSPKTGDIMRDLTNFVGDNISIAYVELRARILARSEREQEKK